MITNIPKAIKKDPWIKVVDFLQQNWAVLIERDNDCLIVFYDDNCQVFDEIIYETNNEAISALYRNGFKKYKKRLDLQKFIELPQGEFQEGFHPNGRIYSSGRFWSY